MSSRKTSASDLIRVLSASKSSRARSYAGRTPGARGLHHSLGEAFEIGGRLVMHLIRGPRLCGGGSLGFTDSFSNTTALIDLVHRICLDVSDKDVETGNRVLENMQKIGCLFKLVLSANFGYVMHMITRNS